MFGIVSCVGAKEYKLKKLTSSNHVLSGKLRQGVPSQGQSWLATSQAHSKIARCELGLKEFESDLDRRDDPLNNGMPDLPNAWEGAGDTIGGCPNGITQGGI